MKVADKMTRSLRIASPDDAICDAAGAMAQVDTGEGPQPAGDALSGVSRPGGAHSQTGGERTGPGA